MPATVKDVPVEVDVSVSDEDQVRIAAWSPDMGVDIEIVFTPGNANKVRDLLNVAEREGRWLA